MKKLILLSILLIVGCPETTKPEEQVDNSIRGYVKDAAGNPINAEIIHTGYYSHASDWDGEMPNYPHGMFSTSNLASPDISDAWIENLCADTIKTFTSLNDIRWDGTDEDGNKVVSGIYRFKSIVLNQIQSFDFINSPSKLYQLEIINNLLGFNTTYAQKDTFIHYNSHALTNSDGFFSIPINCLEFGIEIFGITEYGHPSENWSIPYKTKLWIVHEGDSTFATDWYDVDPDNGVELEITAPY